MSSTRNRCTLLVISILIAVGLGGCGGGGGQPTPPARELFVTNLGGNSVVTFGLANDGTVLTPAYRVIRGPATGIRNPMAVHVMRDGRTFVVNLGDNAGGPSVTEYPAGARGDVTPTLTIEGTVTGLSRPNGIVAGQNVAIAVTNHVEQGTPGTPGVLEFAFGSGSAPPVGRIEGPNTTITGPIGLTRGPSGTLVLAQPEQNRIVGWDFTTGTSLDAAPNFALAGPNTLLDLPSGVAFDGEGKLYVVNRGNSSINVYAAGASGDAAPLRRIGGGGAGNLVDPVGITVDDAGRLYVSQGNVVLRFSATANGAVQAEQRIEDPALSGTMGLAIR